jgi:alpha-L-rhamnosidase
MPGPTAVTGFDKTAVTHLRTEYKVNPVGIDVPVPRLSWEIVSADRGWTQKAYQIQAAADSGGLRDGRDLIWDSGKVVSDRSIHVTYGGPACVSGDRVYWRIRVWDQKDRASGWSVPSFWEMGLLGEADWKARWIQTAMEEDVTQSGPCPLFRKEFTLKGKVKSARAYITSLGLYEAGLNGERIGDQLFTPGWTSYKKRLQYQTYDITDQLKTGVNAIGVTLGDGWYRGCLGWGGKRNFYGDRLALLLQIHVTYENGSEETINTDGSWKSSTGPVLMSDIYNGETYDARLEKAGWTESGYNDQGWNGVTVIWHSKAILAAPPGPPVKRIEEIQPVKILKTPGGDTVFDMGQNMVGRVRLSVKGPAGTVVTLRHAEVLDSSGNFYTENLRSAKQTVRYILKGGGREIYEPRFTFQGFRYVAVDGYPGEPDLQALTGIVIHSDMTPTGTFTCSDEMINQLQHNILWGQKGNFLDVPTDCPQRDERMGWTGDAQVFARTACFNFDAASFYTKWLKDMAADQYEDGSLPHVVPDVLGGSGSAAWADAGVLVPWTVYLCYGDRRILEAQYSSMKGWVEYIRSQAGESRLWNTGSHYGDWLAYNTDRSDYPGATTDKDLIATAYFAHSTGVFIKAARVLGNQEDAREYAALLEEIRTAFQNEFVTPNGRIASNTQTAYTLALAFDLLPESLRPHSAARLAEDVRKFGHITTGFVGTYLICHVLARFGYLDEAYLLLNRKEYPSWLYPITQGATTIWERWDGRRPDGSFQNPGMNSFNHYAYGAIGEWLYHVVAGLRPDETGPGYKHIVFHPHPGGKLRFARAGLHSMYGPVEAAWTIKDGRMVYRITVPPNTQASIRLPRAREEQVLESGKALSESGGILRVEQNADFLLVRVGSGRYEWTFPWIAGETE